MDQGIASIDGAVKILTSGSNYESQLQSQEIFSVTTITLNADWRYQYFYENNDTFTETLAGQMGFEDLELID